MPDYQNNEKTTDLEKVDPEILDAISNLTEEQKKELMPVLEMYSGPIPHPSILKSFDEIDQGAAHKIIKNGLGETSHRRHLENTRVYVKALLSVFAMIGFIGVEVLFIWLSYKLLMSNHVVTGSIFGGVSFLGGIGGLLSLVQTLNDKDDINS